MVVWEKSTNEDIAIGEGHRYQPGCPELLTLWKVPFHVGRQRGWKLWIVGRRAGCSTLSKGWGMLGIQKHPTEKRGMWVPACKIYKRWGGRIHIIWASSNPAHSITRKDYVRSILDLATNPRLQQPHIHICSYQILGDLSSCHRKWRRSATGLSQTSRNTPKWLGL